KLTAYIDVQDESLWYVIIAFTSDFTGYVIDYGVWPEQGARDVSKRRLKKKISEVYKDFKNKEARIRQALSDLCEKILKPDYLDAENRPHSIGMCFIDCADGDASIPLRSWIATSKYRRILRSAIGLGLKAADTPIGERDKKKEELRRGLNWYETRDKKVPTN